MDDAEKYALCSVVLLYRNLQITEKKKHSKYTLNIWRQLIQYLGNNNMVP